MHCNAWNSRNRFQLGYDVVQMFLCIVRTKKNCCNRMFFIWCKTWHFRCQSKYSSITIVYRCRMPKLLKKKQKMQLQICMFSLLFGPTIRKFRFHIYMSRRYKKEDSNEIRKTIKYKKIHKLSMGKIRENIRKNIEKEKWNKQEGCVGRTSVLFSFPVFLSFATASLLRKYISNCSGCD